MSAPIPHHDYVCTCDEPDIDSYVCDPCSEVKRSYWAAYFGLRPGMSVKQRRNQLERMDPHPVSDEQMAEYRELK